jgi:hypothetical protein
MQTNTIKQAGVVLGIIDDNIVTTYEGVDGRDDALIAEVELKGSLLLLECCKATLKLFV